MSLAIALRKPPRWVVHVGHGGEEMTWPFSTRRDAERAYRLALKSGQFSHTLRNGTTVTLVSLWGREYLRGADGKRHVHYVEVPLP